MAEFFLALTGPGVLPTTSSKEESFVPPMPADAVVKEEAVIPPMPSNARWSDALVKEENTVLDTVPPMPADAIVKQEHEIAVDVEERPQKTRRSR